jgi:hypothetical protein
MGDEILDKVWEYTYLQEGKRYTLFMKDEMFYYYHIVHMAKHFQSGGCGIKAILDLWILDNKLPGNSQKRAELISKSKYADFERGVKLLSAVWFDQEPADNFTRLLENYIFKGGAYGTVENGVNVGVAKKGGRIKYVLSRIFPSFRTMRLNYPILEKHKILLPFLHVRRWFRIVFLSGMKKAKSQISHSTKISDAKADEITEMLTKLGLIK